MLHVNSSNKVAKHRQRERCSRWLVHEKQADLPMAIIFYLIVIALPYI